MERADKQSKTNLASRTAKPEDDKSTAEAERDVLIASHKAMLLAVGEMGGMGGLEEILRPLECCGRRPVPDKGPALRRGTPLLAPGWNRTTESPQGQRGEGEDWLQICE